MKKRIGICLLAAVMCMNMLAGCGENGNTETAETSGGASREQETEAPDEDYGTVTIQNGDRTIVFTEMPEKVVCCHLYAAENMVMLGLADRIAGKNIPASDAEKPLDELADQFEGIPELTKSNESVVEVGADLVIGQVSAFKDDAWGSYERLESEGIHALTITGTLVEDETVEHIYQDIENLGKIFKAEDRAEELIADMKEQIASVQEAVSSVDEGEKVKVFVMDSFNGNEIYTTSSGLESNLIELAGGINCTRGLSDSRWFNTSVETLVETDPDIIIFNDYGSQTIEEKQDFINSNPALQDVTAVKNQAYLTIPLVAVMQDIRAASACRTFAEYFYPECFR